MQISDLDYADYIAILGESFTDFRLTIDEMQVNAWKISMKINTQMSKLLNASFLPTERHTFVLDMETLEVVDCFKYFGTIITTTSQGEEDVFNSISNARLTFCRLEGHNIPHKGQDLRSLGP